MMLRIVARKALREFVLDVTLDAASGVTLVIGPSGSGKTTLLRLIAGVERLDGGTIALGDTLLAQAPSLHLAPGARDIAMLFQDYALFPHLSVAQNVAYGLEARRQPRAERDERVRSMLRRLGIASLARERPSELSGGQRQRVALARALVLEPRALLLDEPLASLDLQTRIAVRAEIAQTLRSLTIPTLIVSHDPADAPAFRERVVVIEQGRISQDDPLERTMESPATPFIQAFAGEIPKARNLRRTQTLTS